MRALSLSRRTVLTAGLAALAAPALAERSTPGPVTLGQVSLSFYAVTGAVVHQVLERLGHQVTVREGLHEQMFPLLAGGEIDLMAAAWLPEGHADYWRRYGGSAREVARLYEGAHFFWGVPDYVPADTVRTMADLADPAIAGRFTKAIQGIGAGAAISQLTKTALSAYGLEPLGYTFTPGTQAQWIKAYETARAANAWIVFPTWAPQYLNRDGKLRPLADPKGILGGQNHASLVAPDQRWQALPARTRTVLARLSLGIDAVTEMDWQVNAGGMTPRQAAAAWMAANPAQVEAWFAA